MEKLSPINKKKILEHSKLHKGGIRSKHIRNMVNAMNDGDTFAAAHKKAVSLDKKQMPKKYSSPPPSQRKAYTFKQKFNQKYKQPLGKSNSLQAIAKLTGYKLSNIKKIFQKGIGAYKTNPGSVRPRVQSPEQWAYARVYSAVMGGPSAKVDKDLLK